MARPHMSWFCAIFTLGFVFSSVFGKQLHVLLLTSSSERLNSSGAVSSAMMATALVNAAPYLLPGYDIITINRDTKCDGTTSVREFLMQVMLTSPTIIGVIGCGCSVATEPVADVVSLYGLPLISFTSSAAGLETKSLTTTISTPSYYQLFPSDDNLVLAIVALIKEYNWTQVSIISEKEDLFLKLEDQLCAAMTAANVTVLNPSHFTVAMEQLENSTLLDGKYSSIFAPDARIFIVNSFENKARQLLCMVYWRNRNMKYPDFAWILYGWYSVDWWKSTNDVNCTEDQLATMLDRALVIQQYPTTENISADAVGGLMQSQICELQEGSSSPFVETLTHDSVWTLALALNRTLNMISTNDTLDCGPFPVPLELFTYTGSNSSSTSCLIRQSLSKTNFSGLSGKVFFSQQGIREVKCVRLLQYRNSSAGLHLVQFGYVELDALTQDVIYVTGERDETVWLDGIPPDGTEMTVISPISNVVIAVVYIGSGVGVVIAIICLSFNIIFRNRKVVRLTSPNINYIIVVGSLMLYLTACFSVLPTTDEDIWNGFCKTIAIMSSVGFSLTFGPIIAKVWRIYYIFRNPTAKKKRVSDWFLLLIIAVIVGIAVLLIIIGYSIPMCLPRAYTQPDASRQPTRNDRGIRVRYLIISCFPDECDAWVAIVFAYLGILQLTSFVLALLIRKVTIPVLNESKEISAIIYFTTILVFEMLIFGLLLGQYNDLQEGLFNAHLILATTVVLVFLFVPKMLALYKDPLGEKIFSQHTVNQGSTLGVEAVANKEKLHVLQRRVTALQEELMNARAVRVRLNEENNVKSPVDSPSNPSIHVVEYSFDVKKQQEFPVY